MVLADPDGVLLFESLGARSLEPDEPMSEDTIFRIYSMTKPITATAVMLLTERGALEPDDPVGVHLPELADLEVGVEIERQDGTTELQTEPADRPITIRDLLRHTSGFTYGPFDQSPVDTLPEMVARLSRLPLKSILFQSTTCDLHAPLQ